MTARRVLYVVACGAKPAADVPVLVELARGRGWEVCVGTTPSGWGFVDADRLRELTGHQVRNTYSGRTSGWPAADGVIVAPATINTIDKLAAGIADTWALTTLIECYGLGVPIVMAPNVNPALARHPRFRQNVAEMRTWGISILWDEHRRSPAWMAPWLDMLTELERRIEHAAAAPEDPRHLT